MDDTTNHDATDDVAAARQRFRAALNHTHETRTDVGHMEAAAAKFCQTMRRSGMPPEGAVRPAKQVIEETIDGHNQSLAERAVSRCIEYYFRE